MTAIKSALPINFMKEMVQYLITVTAINIKSICINFLILGRKLSYFVVNTEFILMTYREELGIDLQAVSQLLLHLCYLQVY